MIAPVRSWQMGREEEIAYAREHGIPVKGGTEAAPYSIDDNLWGRSSEGRWIEDLDARARGRRLSAGHAPRAGARRARDGDGRVRRAACRWRSNGERLELVELLEARRRDRRAPRRGHRRPHRGPHRRAEGARHLRGARGGDPAAGPSRARAAGVHDPPEPVQGAARPPVGLPRLRGPVVGAAARRPRRLHASRSTSASPGRSASSCTRVTRAWSRAPRPTPSTTPPWPPSRSRAACSRRPPRRASSSCGRCSRAWPGACATSSATCGARGAAGGSPARAAVGRARRVACARERKRLQAARLRRSGAAANGTSRRKLPSRRRDGRRRPRHGRRGRRSSARSAPCRGLIATDRRAASRPALGVACRHRDRRRKRDTRAASPAGAGGPRAPQRGRSAGRTPRAPRRRIGRARADAARRGRRGDRAHAGDARRQPAAAPRRRRAGEPADRRPARRRTRAATRRARRRRAPTPPPRTRAGAASASCSAPPSASTPSSVCAWRPKIAASSSNASRARRSSG